MFVDEAYALARGGEKDFGKEAIDTLVKAMEDHKNELVVILAGYRNEMDYFLSSNPGLEGRFPLKIDFPDYDDMELLKIAKSMFESREYVLDEKAQKILEDFMKEKNIKSQAGFSNARLIRNVVEASIRRQALRLMSKEELTRDDLLHIGEEDIRSGIKSIRKEYY